MQRERKKGRNKIKVLLVLNLFLLYIMLFSFSACVGESIAPIRIQNNTEETLSIFINDEHIGNVISGEEIKNELITITVRFIIEARNSHGHTIYKEKITLEDMEELNWKIIISP